MKFIRKKGILILFIVIIASLATFFFVFKPAEPRNKPKIYVVKEGVVRPYLLATGNIYPEGFVKLQFKIQGTVESVEIKPGDKVEEGQVLATLKSDDLEQQLETARYNLESAMYRYQQLKFANQYQLKQLKNQVDQAFKQYRNFDDKYKSTSAKLENLKTQYSLNPDPALLSEIGLLESNLEQIKGQLEQAKFNYEQQLLNYESVKKKFQYDEKIAYVQVKQARSALQNLEQRQKLTKLVAPFDGIVLYIGYKKGSKTNAAQGITSASTVVSASQNSSLEAGDGIIIAPENFRHYAEVSVDQIDIAKIKPGLEVEGTIDAYPDLKLKGKIEEISLYPESSGSSAPTYQVKVIFDPLNKLLTPGVLVTLKIKLHSEKGLIIPVEAVRFLNSIPYIYLPDNRGGFRQRQIRTGATDNKFIIVLSGLSAGDKILASAAELTLGNLPANNQNSNRQRMFFGPKMGPRSQ
jgi:HlyD family secretion protein/macrolide-specific efflux system membrane fusion protein